MKLTKTLLNLCISSTLLFTASSALAQTLRAADVHPADYPNVVAVKHMGEKLSAATEAVWISKPSPAACWVMKNR